MQIKEQKNPIIMELQLQILKEANTMHLQEPDQVHEIQTYDPKTSTLIISYIYKIDQNELPN
jgi:hypothetical protein